MKVKPAAHRGFLARAKKIPATELYRLAQRRDRRLVLCGHSLGGAVAVLATLAILRAFAKNSISRAANKVEVKCITFSQPPVGNAALRDYVHKKDGNIIFGRTASRKMSFLAFYPLLTSTTSARNQ